MYGKKKRQDGGETSQGLRKEGNSGEGRVKTVDTLHDTSMTLTVMLLLHFENKVTILYIFEEVKKNPPPKKKTLTLATSLTGSLLAPRSVV